MADISIALFYCLYSLNVNMMFIVEMLYVVIKLFKEALHPNFIEKFVKLLKFLHVSIKIKSFKKHATSKGQLICLVENVLIFYTGSVLDQLSVRYYSCIEKFFSFSSSSNQYKQLYFLFHDSSSDGLERIHFDF